MQVGGWIKDDWLQQYSFEVKPCLVKAPKAILGSVPCACVLVSPLYMNHL